MSRPRTFDFQQFQAMLEETRDRKTIAAILIVAMDHWKRKVINDFAFAGILRIASGQVYKITE